MAEHRYEAHATITPGEHELCGHTLRQLVTVTLTDAGAITHDDGSEHERADVFCALRTGEARELAGRLLELADTAETGLRR